FPTCVYYILGSEFCERFSYYGLRTILVIYLTKWLLYSSDDATIIYHSFCMLCYLSPLLGAIIADGYLGRYKTIMYLSIVYAIGNIVLSLTALPPTEVYLYYRYGPIIGLILIGIGTGGIKPCVSAMGGDQFSSDQVKERLAFFSLFYFMINFGSMLSTVISPVLRADVHCIKDSCYPLAFGVPALLMIIALVIFWAGRKQYKHVLLTGNVIGQVAACIMVSSKKKKSHWLNHAEDKYEVEFISDVKQVLKVLWIFLPLPVFWALFDQQGSRWTLQAEQMDGHGSLGRIKPDQLQVLNPILILIFIPIFQHIVYPLLDRCKVPNRPIQKMVVGMIFACGAFIIAGFVQIKLDVRLYRAYLCYSSDLHYSPRYTLYGISCFITFFCPERKAFKKVGYKTQVLFFKNKKIECKTQIHFILCIRNRKVRSKILFYFISSIKTEMLDFKIKGKKPKAGKSQISMISYLPLQEEVSVDIKSSEHIYSINITHSNISQYHSIEPGSYGIYLPDQNGTSSYSYPVTLGSGAVYTLILTAKDLQNYDPRSVDILTYTSVNVNEMSMLYMIPQYIVITIGEILFSITGLSFAYNEAPTSMKSVVQAGWLMTMGIGNLIVVFVAEISLLPSQTAEFFLFASLMGLDIIIFSIMSCFYKYSYTS
ncbi:hypothetical protein LOTGIDRAFT_92134, partial [Lottia gigantea]